MDTKFDIVDRDNIVRGSFTGAEYSDARAYAKTLDPDYEVGSHGGPGGPGPQRMVDSALLEAVFAEHGRSGAHAASPSVAALKAHVRTNHG